jgi:hypothetical protein
MVGDVRRGTVLGRDLVGGVDDALREIVQRDFIVGIGELDPSTREELGKRRLILRSPAG